MERGGDPRGDRRGEGPGSRPDLPGSGAGSAAAWGDGAGRPLRPRPCDRFSSRRTSQRTAINSTEAPSSSQASAAHSAAASRGHSIATAARRPPPRPHLRTPRSVRAVRATAWRRHARKRPARGRGCTRGTGCSSLHPAVLRGSAAPDSALAARGGRTRRQEVARTARTRRGVLRRPARRGLWVGRGPALGSRTCGSGEGRLVIASGLRLGRFRGKLCRGLGGHGPLAESQ